MRYGFLIFALTFILFGFNTSHHSTYHIDSVSRDNDDTLRYIFLGHIGSGVTKWVDERIEQLILTPYDRIWLGGDMMVETMLDRHNLIYLDGLFNLGDSSTQFALGNHDIRNGNIQYYHEFTGRKSFNVYSRNGAVSICMNSQLSPAMCEDLNDQFDLIKQVCDTIQDAKHLFLFMHSVLYAGVPNIPPSGTFAHTDFRHWNANCVSSTNTFATAIFPMLQQVRDRGITVYVIAGDAGSNQKKYHNEADDSIHFYASGIANSKFTDSAELAQQPKDRILIFEHILTNQEMNWYFRDLDSLLSAQ